MIDPPFARGQFIWCRFPFREAPLRPGPVEHIAYVADIRQLRGKLHLTVMSIYTTTVPWAPGVPLPPGVIPVDTAMAAKMGQRGFVMDCRRIALVPLVETFFPRLRQPDRGVVHSATPGFQKLVLNTLATLAKRPDLVVALGPDAPRPPSGQGPGPGAGRLRRRRP